MRKAEAKWSEDKKETREQYLARLRRVAKATPSTLINKAMQQMANRCELLFKAKGGHFEESLAKSAENKKGGKVKKRSMKK